MPCTLLPCATRAHKLLGRRDTIAFANAGAAGDQERAPLPAAPLVCPAHRCVHAVSPPSGAWSVCAQNGGKSRRLLSSHKRSWCCCRGSATRVQAAASRQLTWEHVPQVCPAPRTQHLHPRLQQAWRSTGQRRGSFGHSLPAAIWAHPPHTSMPLQSAARAPPLAGAPYMGGSCQPPTPMRRCTHSCCPLLWRTMNGMELSETSITCSGSSGL